MSTFTLRQAYVTPDGELVRALFVAGVAAGNSPVNRLTDLGFVDYIPAALAGQRATLDGQPLEVVGVQCEDWTEPLPWIDPPTNGGSIPAGSYFFLVAFVDKDGNEIGICPPIFGNSNEAGELGVDLPANASVMIRSRPSPAGAVKYRVYMGIKKPMLDNLRLVAEEWMRTGYRIDAYTPDESKRFLRQSVGLWVTLATTSRPVTKGEQPRLVLPPALVADENGNGTGPVIAYLDNRSLVNSQGKIDGDAFQYATTYYLSSSHGDDVGDGSIGKPWKTLARLSKSVPTQSNIRIRFLRGDIFPFESWTVAYPGLTATKPTVYDSYWNADYGTDPKTRPILLGDASNQPDPNGLRNWFRQADTRTGRAAVAPYQYWLGLEFRGPQGDSCKSPCWPAGEAQDSIVLSDCLFDNVQLIGSYGSAQKLASMGCMIHSTMVRNVHASPSRPNHIQGLFIAHCGDFLISHSTFEQNGWRYDGITPDPTRNDVFCHNVYLASMARQTVLYESGFNRGGLSGVQQRGGGVCARCWFDGNVSGYSAHDTHMLFNPIFKNQGTYNHIASPAPSYGPVAIHDLCQTKNIAGFDQTRRQVVNYDGLHSFHHNSEGTYVPHMIIVRHETSRNGGDISMGNQLPTGRLIVTDNRIDNTAKDYKGNPLRNVVLKDGSTPWNKPQITWDNNVYTRTTSYDPYVWGKKYTTQFSEWQTTGFDANGQELLPGQPDPVPVPPAPIPPSPPAPVVDPLTVFLATITKAAIDYAMAIKKGQ